MSGLTKMHGNYVLYGITSAALKIFELQGYNAMRQSLITSEAFGPIFQKADKLVNVDEPTRQELILRTICMTHNEFARKIDKELVDIDRIVFLLESPKEEKHDPILYRNSCDIARAALTILEDSGYEAMRESLMKSATFVKMFENIEAPECILDEKFAREVMIKTICETHNECAPHCGESLVDTKKMLTLLN